MHRNDSEYGAYLLPPFFITTATDFGKTTLFTYVLSLVFRGFRLVDFPMVKPPKPPKPHAHGELLHDQLRRYTLVQTAQHGTQNEYTRAKRAPRTGNECAPGVRTDSLLGCARDNNAPTSNAAARSVTLHASRNRGAWRRRRGFPGCLDTAQSVTAVPRRLAEAPQLTRAMPQCTQPHQPPA